jgi:GNAT superfamily N-acetyltransferase
VPSPLDDPIGSSLEGRHAHLALRHGLAARYPADVAVFGALAEPSRRAVEDLEALVAPGEGVALLGGEPLDDPGPGWACIEPLMLVQMVCDAPLRASEIEATELGEKDVEEMIALVEATQPGPFARRTLELGRYLGHREAGRLVAMGGERLKPEGHTELSAICTDSAFRGRGLAEGLVRVLGENPGAIALYEKLGFRERLRRPLARLVRLEGRVAGVRDGRRLVTGFGG